MTNSETGQRTPLPGPSATADEGPGHPASSGGRTSRAISTAGKGAATLGRRVPGTVHATQSGALRTTRALRTLPDSTLRWLAASSVGLGAGFYLAGAPRLAVAAGVAPALFLGAAIVGRPITMAVPSKVR